MKRSFRKTQAKRRPRSKKSLRRKGKAGRRKSKTMKRVRGGASKTVKCDCKINGETKPSEPVSNTKMSGQIQSSEGNKGNEGQTANGNGNNNGLPQNEAQSSSTGQGSLINQSANSNHGSNLTGANTKQQTEPAENIPK